MKTVLVLLFIFGAAFAAPAEEPKKAPEAPVVKEEEAAAPEMKDKMMKKDKELPVHQDFILVPRNVRINFCPDGWFSYDFRCFMLVNTPMTWHNAEDHCRNMGGHLASATSPGEYAFLQQLTMTAGQSVAWLGGFNLQGRWMWIEPTGFYYTNWYAQNSYSSHPCIYLQTTAGWSNVACSTSYRFICSRNPFGC